MLLDPARFPSAAAYLEAVPAGLSSFRECESTADIALIARQTHPEAFAGPGIDESLRAAIFAPGDPGEWIPDVLNVAIRLMVRDAAFASDADYLRWHYDQARAVFARPAYRVLMYVMSPTLVLMGATKRWARFRRGTTLSGKRTRGGSEITLVHPPRIYPELVLRGYGESFRAAIVAAQGADARVVLGAMRETETQWLASWR